MSASGSTKNHPIFQLRQLHLIPHHIYMISQQDFTPTSRYVWEMWKDDTKMGETSDIKNIQPNNVQKYPALQFGKMKFIFDVQALFESQSSAKINFRLSQKGETETILKEQFQIHLLYYNYQHSHHHMVKRKENSIGKINQFIFNYSFEAIYGEPPENTFFKNYEFQAKQSDIVPEIKPLIKKASKYGIIVKDPILAGHYDTLALVEAVVSQATANLNVPILDSASQKISMAPSSSQRFQRQAVRSVFQENALIQRQQSNITELETAEKIKMQSSFIGGWVLIFLGTFLIYLLMHPNRRQ